MKRKLHTAIIVTGVLLFCSGLFMAFGWPIVLMLAGAAVAIAGIVTQ